MNKKIISILPLFLTSIGFSTNHNIYIVSGQSNAKPQYAQGIANGMISDSDAVIYHRYHSGNWLLQWVDGFTPDTFAYGPNFLNDFWNYDETSGLQELIQDYETNGDTWDIKGFFWFQGEGDTSSYQQMNVYQNRFEWMLNSIEILYSLNHNIPFVITLIDADPNNGDLSSLNRTMDDINYLRDIQTNIANSNYYGNYFDSRGWNRVDLWHVGSETDPQGIYALLTNLGYDESVILPNQHSYADINNDGLIDLHDLSVFIDFFQENNMQADFAFPIGVLDQLDIITFVNNFNNGSN